MTEDAPAIAHISDLHCGSPHFQAELLERAIEEINELQPGRHRDQRRPDDRRLPAASTRSRASSSTASSASELIVVPGNHDSRNVGYVHFEEMFGPRHSELHANGVSIVAEDSSEPDLDHGQIGRNRYEHIEQSFAHPADLRIFVLHHHLLPVPGHRPRAQHRLRRGRPARGAAALAREPRARRAQARALRVAAREPVRGHDRHGLDAAAARPHAPLLQRDRDRSGVRADRAPLSVRRAGADHRVVTRDAARVREGGPARAALGESTAEAGRRDARHRAHRRRAPSRGRARRARLACEQRARDRRGAVRRRGGEGVAAR